MTDDEPTPEPGARSLPFLALGLEGSGMNGFYICSDLLNEYLVQRLTPAQFKQHFYSALTGNRESVFAPYVRRSNGRLPAKEWRLIRDRIFRRDDFTCAYCGIRGVALECDHVIPVCQGGPHDDSNLTTSCKQCNQSKHGRTVEQWKKL